MLKCTFNRAQCGGGRHLEFRKGVDISLLLDQCAPNLVGMLRIWYGTHCIVKKHKFTRSQEGGCRHLELRKTFEISSPFDLFSPNLVGCCYFDVECNCWLGNEHKDWIRRWRLLPYWISKRCGHFITLLLNRFSPNMLLISNTGLLVEKRQILMLKTI